MKYQLAALLTLSIALIGCGGGGGSSSSVASSGGGGGNPTNNIYPFVTVYDTSPTQLFPIKSATNAYYLMVEDGDQITISFFTKHEGGDDATVLTHKVVELVHETGASTTLTPGVILEFDKNSGGWDGSLPASTIWGLDITVDEDDYKDAGGDYYPIQYTFTVDIPGTIAEDDETDNIYTLTLIYNDPI